MYSYPSNYNKNFNPSGLPYSVMLPETLDFQTRMTAAGGNLLSDKDLNAINYWISQYKYYNLWDKMIAYYPLVGGNGGAGSFASFSINLKSSSYTLLNRGGITDAMCNTTGFKNTGATGTGSNVLFNTQINDSTDLNIFNKGLSCYIRSNEIVATAYYDMGCYLAAYTNLHIIGINNNGPGVFTGAISDYWGGSVIPSPVEAARYLSDKVPIQGFYSGARKDRDLFLFKNGVILVRGKTNTTTGINVNIHLNGGIRETAVTTNVSLRTYGSWAVHQAYTPDEEKQRAIIEQNFQNLLGRAVSIS